MLRLQHPVTLSWRGEGRSRETSIKWAASAEASLPSTLTMIQRYVVSRCLRTTLRSQTWKRLVSTSRATAHLNTVNENDLVHFSKILPPSSILSTLPPNGLPASELSTYNSDWMGKYHGKSQVVLRPKTTEQISQILKHCSERRLGVVPQGGNTGLVGGSVPINEEVVINLGSMNTVRSFDSVSGEHQH